MKVTLLGTGDAIGTPKIGCNCPQCTSAHRTGVMRLRTSLLVENDDHSILIDTSPDLRFQLLRSGSPHIDAVIWTHGHYDHFIGLGEFYRVQKLPPVYAAPETLEYCESFFRFLHFERHPVPPFTPFHLSGLEFTLVEVSHPPIFTCGLVIKSEKSKFAYTSDTRAQIPEKSMALMRDADLMLLDALVPPGYHISKHMNYQDARELALFLNAHDFRCVHMSHNMPFDIPGAGHDGECFLLP
jgi:phosphoribosyl 1,2-cyclic phosphate phosphodiesterase